MSFLLYEPVQKNVCAAMRFRHLPGHHAAYACPSTPAHKETHCWVRDSVPSPAHKEDDGGIEGIQLERRNGKKGVRLKTQTKMMPNTASYGTAS